MDTAVTYAGFWKRLAAFIIDAVLLAVVLALLGVHTGPSYMMRGYGMMSSYSRGSYGALFGGAVLLKLILGWIYYAAMESSHYQATLGKMALGIKVTDIHHARLSFARATGRHFAKILSAIIFCIGFLMIAFTKHKQGLHDIIAGALVVNK